MLALPIFTASRPATIVGADELNFCVRDGNRWTLIAINTNYISSPLQLFTARWTSLLYRTFLICQVLFSSPSSLVPARQSRTKDEKRFVQGFRNSKELVTRTGFEPMLMAWEATVLTTWPTGHFPASLSSTSFPTVEFWSALTDSTRGPTD